MCGIVGVFSKSRKNLPDINIATMRDTMESRGPDSSGSWSSDTVSLGHRRLAVIDINNTGHQPMIDPETGNVIVFNGEIYNYKSLRQRLEHQGITFTGDSDTEVLLKAYRLWGENCLNNFIGMYAFAIWDKSEQSLFAARDRIGIKPLYFYETSDLFAFASRPEAIFKCNLFPKELNQDSVSLFFEFGYIPGNKTIFNNLCKLPAGHYLKVKNGRLQISCYWDILEKASHQKECSPAEFSEHLEDLIKSSIKLRCIADVPLGAFLSGGIDSSLVVSLLAEQSSKPPKTFSIGFEDKNYDESPYAKKFSELCGTEHHELIATELDLLGLLDSVSANFDEPFADASALPTLLLSRFASESATVCLSGDGGDELFLGYPQYRKIDQIRHIYSIPTGIRNFFADYLIPTKSPKLVHIKKCLSHSSSIETFSYIRNICRDYSHKFLKKNNSRTNIFEIMKSIAIEIGDKENIEIFSLIDMKTYLSDGILHKVDVASMAYSLEVRVPLLDHRIVEYILSTPLSVKFDSNIAKAPLKKILSKTVPEYNYNRPKAGFNAPIKSWFRHELKGMVLDQISVLKSGNYEYLDTIQIEKIVNDHMKGYRDNESIIWSLLCFIRWHEQHLRN